MYRPAEAFQDSPPDGCWRLLKFAFGILVSDCMRGPAQRLKSMEEPQCSVLQLSSTFTLTTSPHTDTQIHLCLWLIYRVWKSLFRWTWGNTEQRDKAEYCKKWRLQQGVEGCFQWKGEHKLIIKLDGQHIDHKKTPTYLVASLDRSLTYCYHLKKTAATISMWNSLLSKDT